MKPKYLKTFAGVLFLAVTTALVILFFPSSSPSAPVITWTPEKVSVTISPGASKSITVSFVSSEDLNDVKVRVVPALEPYIRVSQISSPSVARGKDQPIYLEISIPDTAHLGEASGAIHLVVGRRTIAKPLEVTIGIGDMMTDATGCYQLRYYDDLSIIPLNSRRPKFLSGKTLSSSVDGLHISVLIYDNSTLEEIPQWYQNNLADKEYSFPEFNRVTELVTVNALQALKVYSRFEGDHHLRYYIGNGNIVYSVETTTSDDVDVPWQFFEMLNSFATICSY